MKKFLSATLIVVFFVALLVIAYFYFKYFSGIWLAILPPREDIAKVLNETGMPLSLPKDFSISIFAKDLPGARVMAQDVLGNLWISQTSEGNIALLEVKEGKVINQNNVFSGLKNPHGL